MTDLDVQLRWSTSMCNLDGQCPIALSDLDEQFLNSLSGLSRRRSSVVVRVVCLTILAITRRATLPQPGYLNLY